MPLALLALEDAYWAVLAGYLIALLHGEDMGVLVIALTLMGYPQLALELL